MNKGLAVLLVELEGRGAGAGAGGVPEEGRIWSAVGPLWAPGAGARQNQNPNLGRFSTPNQLQLQPTSDFRVPRILSSQASGAAGNADHCSASAQWLGKRYISEHAQWFY